MCIHSPLGALLNNTLLEIINLLPLMRRKTGSTASGGGNGEGRGDRKHKTSPFDVGGQQKKLATGGIIDH